MEIIDSIWKQSKSQYDEQSIGTPEVIAKGYLVFRSSEEEQQETDGIEDKDIYSYIIMPRHGITLESYLDDSNFKLSK